MNDDELLSAFEGGSIPYSEWNHRAHVRVAASYLIRHGLDEATRQVRSGIKSNNVRYGIVDGPHRGYHETTTQAFVQLIYHTIQRCGSVQNSIDLCDHCPQLLDRRVLMCYYTRDHILQPFAKTSFTEPDIVPLDRVGLAYPEFGLKVPSVEYTLRPGGYGIIANEEGRLAVVVTPIGTYLPGGGEEPGESAKAAFQREALEECGLVVDVIKPIGVADEYAFAEAERQHFCKRCSFYAADFRSVGVASEPDHVLEWLIPEEAIEQLSCGSQRWAVRQYITQAMKAGNIE